MMKSNDEKTKKELVPDHYEEWAKVLFNEAHLPDIGLPVNWDKTQKKHCLVAFDPKTKEKIKIDTNELFKHTSRNPVGFITSTAGKSTMQGTETPAAARYQRYGELDKHAIHDGSGKQLIPCIAHGDYVQVESLQADHLQAKEQILKRQVALVDKLNDKDDQAFAQFLLKQPGMDKFFVKHKGKYYGTLFFYELYFNDIDNIWLICGACNLHKSDDDTRDWFQNQWLYGQEFLDYLGGVDPESKIIEKVKNKRGLAEVAIEWFWQRHANYISVKKNLLEKIIVPVDILNKKVDHLMGSGQEKRAERWELSLNFRMSLLQAVMDASLDMPRRDSDTSSSGDEQSYLPVEELSSPVTKSQYKKGTERLSKTIGSQLENFLVGKIQEVKNEEKEEAPRKQQF